MNSSHHFSAQPAVGRLRGQRMLVACLLQSAAVLMGEPNRDLPELHSCAQVQQLSVAEAAREYPVNIQGVVTYVDPGTGDMFVQDRTAGVFVFVRDSKASSFLRAGQRVSLHGVSTPADFSPSVTNARIEVLGPGHMPEPKRLAFDQLVAGRQDAGWVEAEGVVHSGQIKSDRLFLNVITTGGSFVAIMSDFPREWARTLPNTKVVVRGVLAAIFNEHRQSVATRIFIPGPRFIRAKGSSSSDGFDLPISSTLTVGQFHPKSDLESRIHVRATVLAVEADTGMYVSDAEGSLQVEAFRTCSAKPGDLIDVVGFPAAIDSRPGLQDAICRTRGKGMIFTPASVTADQIIPDSLNTDASGYGLSGGTRYDLKLIRIEGVLVQTTGAPDGDTWLLENGKRIITVKIPAGVLPPKSRPENGTRLRLVGACVLSYDRYHRAQFFRVLVRHAEDIAVLSRPGWFTLRAVLWGLVIAIVFCLSILIWASTLKRQVGQKTRELQEANSQLKRLSHQDFLTGAANRRLLDETLAGEMERAKSSRQPVSLLMIDIDHFKSVNDQYGHQMGDDYLVRIARLLQSVVNESRTQGEALVARYGGEEFAVILPGANRREASEIAEEMRRRVFHAEIPHTRASLGRLSISVGLAATGESAELSAQVLLEAADRALYNAKSAGRNSVVSIQHDLEPVA